MKKLSYIASALLLASALSAQDIIIKTGWQIKGTDGNFTMSDFNKSCIDIVWMYDRVNKSWQGYSPDTDTQQLINNTFLTLTNINPTDGFWVKGNSDIDCVVTPPSTAVEETLSSTMLWKGSVYGTVTSAQTKRVWLDRNLGASQVCTSVTDELCYGDYYQWGRGADGHEKATSTTTSIQTTSTIPGNSSFITQVYNGTADWTSADTDGTLRSTEWSKTDGSSICPVGFRVPTQNEITLELAAISNSDDAFNILKLPLSGYRNFDDGLITRDFASSIWMSDAYINTLDYYASDAYTLSNVYSYGNAVRCIKD